MKGPHTDPDNRPPGRGWKWCAWCEEWKRGGLKNVRRVGSRSAGKGACRPCAHDLSKCRGWEVLA